MSQSIYINQKIKSFKKNIFISGDKSLSIRFALMASQAVGKSKIYNLLNSEDVLSTLNCLKKLGIKLKNNKKYCEIHGKGLNGFSFKNNTILNCQNSGTLARLICGLLSKSIKSVILKGDKSLSKRDFSRVIKPLNLFGIKIKSNNHKLPLKITGTNYLRPIKWNEMLKSAQVKTSILLASLNTPGITKINALKSRDHTERLFKFLKIPISIKKKNKFDLIKTRGQYQYKSFIAEIPGDISSASFFIILALLSKDSEILIKNVNVNKTRTGIVDMLKKMNAKIKIQNYKISNGEEIADINVKNTKKLKAIKPNPSINSRAIDELPLIFLACSKAKGISYFRDLGELRHKEQDRLRFSAKFLKMIGIKVIETKNSLKIYGNPNLNLDGKYVVKNFMKDHRAFMMSAVAALSLGGDWKIHDSDSVKTSFPTFLNIIKKLGAKFNK
tara:strand:+ start:891 stop:2219 length:1329 start_codon:yes stop_codon:yes gene_type:complete